MIRISCPALPDLEEYVQNLEDIWENRMLSNFGPYAQRFEEKVRNISRAKYCRAVANCDLGLIITLKAFNLKPGSEVLVPSFTFNSTGNAILWNGLKPRFVDIDTGTLNMDTDDLRSKISNKASAILATNTFGYPSDMFRLHVIAKAHDLPLIFDSAHAFGAYYNERPIARYGDAHVFSFAGTKVVTTGEGGAIVTPHKWMADRIKYLRAYGFQGDYNSKYLGLNAKMSEMAAALGLHTLDNLSTNIEYREKLYMRYRTNLMTYSEEFYYPLIRVGSRPTYPYFTIIFNRPYHSRRVAALLKKSGVETKKYYMPLHKSNIFRKYRGPLSSTNWVYQRILNLPQHTEMDLNDVDRICDVVRRVLDG